MIPFNKPGLVGTELERIADAIAQGHAATGGPMTQKCTEFLRHLHEAEAVLLTTSCTDALEMSAMLLDLGPGDVVIVPSFTFTSTATAFARQGAKLRFCDINPVTLGLDPVDVEAAMSPEVKAIVTVHYAGVPSQVRELVELAERYGVPLIEDNAHGLFGTDGGQVLGTFGRMSTLSFHETKNFHCGEGGALILNEPADVDRAHVLLDKGTNRRQFLDGAVDKYTWQGHGSSFGISDLLAAFLVAQFEHADLIRAKRRNVAVTYRSLLESHVDRLGLRLPPELAGTTAADHMFYVLLPPAVDRNEILTRMRQNDVQATFHYVPLHSAPGAKDLAAEFRPCPVTDDVSARLLRMPFFNDLTQAEIARSVGALVEALEQSISLP